MRQRAARPLDSASRRGRCVFAIMIDRFTQSGVERRHDTIHLGKNVTLVDC